MPYVGSALVESSETTEKSQNKVVAPRFRRHRPIKATFA